MSVKAVRKARPVFGDSPRRRNRGSTSSTSKRLSRRARPSPPASPTDGRRSHLTGWRSLMRIT